MTLTVATGLLVSLCYVVAAPERQPTGGQHNDTIEVAAAELRSLCQQTAEALRATWPQDWSIFVRPPFVMAGDFSDEELETLYVETVLPTERALQLDYFDQAPRKPISLLILSNDDAFRAAVERAGYGGRAEYAGLYLRRERTVLVNYSAGVGALTHELTHALAHADCPELPEWFDEGLASLYEEADLSADGLRLIGRDNWRMRFLQEAEERGCLEPFEVLCTRPFAPRPRAALDYALARYVCLFLQDRGLLSAFYRKCRGLIRLDPTGRLALLRVFSDRSLDEIDHEFRTWLRSRW